MTLGLIGFVLLIVVSRIELLASGRPCSPRNANPLTSRVRIQ